MPTPQNTQNGGSTLGVPLPSLNAQPQQQEQLDPTIVALAKAIRTVETGGKDVKGGSGELASMYQFMPDTWKMWAGEVLGDPNAPLTRENQNKVAYKKIEQWKQKGYNPAQIAAAWNAGEGAVANDKWKSLVGTNSAGVQYNTPAYVEKVYKEYQYQKGAVQDATKPASRMENMYAEAAQAQSEAQKAASEATLPSVVSNLTSSVGNALFPAVAPITDQLSYAWTNLQRLLGMGAEGQSERNIDALRSQVQQKLADPNVSPETKQRLIKAGSELDTVIAQDPSRQGITGTAQDIAKSVQTGLSLGGLTMAPEAIPTLGLMKTAGIGALGNYAYNVAENVAEGKTGLSALSPGSLNPTTLEGGLNIAAYTLPGAVKAVEKVASLGKTADQIAKTEAKLKEYMEAVAPLRREVELAEVKGLNIPRMLAESDDLLPTVNKSTGRPDTEAAEIFVQGKIDQYGDSVYKLLKTDPGTINVVDWYKQAMRELKSTSGYTALEGDDLTRAEKALAKDFARFLREAGKRGELPLARVHQIKVAKSRKVNYNDPDYASKTTVQKAIADTARSNIEAKSLSPEVKEANRELSKYYTLQGVYEKMKSHPVKGGRLGGYANRALGWAVGSAAGPVGTVLGDVAGQALTAAQRGAFFRSPVRRLFTGKIAKQDPEVFKRVQEEMAKRAAMLALPAGKPKTAFGRGNANKAVTPDVIAGNPPESLKLLDENPVYNEYGERIAGPSFTKPLAPVDESKYGFKTPKTFKQFLELPEEAQYAVYDDLSPKLQKQVDDYWDANPTETRLKDMVDAEMQYFSGPPDTFNARPKTDAELADLARQDPVAAERYMDNLAKSATPEDRKVFEELSGMGEAKKSVAADLKNVEGTMRSVVDDLMAGKTKILVTKKDRFNGKGFAKKTTGEGADLLKRLDRGGYYARITTTDPAKGRPLDEVLYGVQANGKQANVDDLVDEIYKRAESKSAKGTEAYGAAAGIQPEYNENGDMTGITINPEYAVMGMAGTTVGTKLQKEIKKLAGATPEVKNLVVVHKTSEEKLRFMNRIGGMPNPSIGIVRADKGNLSSFGDITLIADPGLIDPRLGKKVQTFNADIYSPRGPRAELHATKEVEDKVLADLGPIKKEVFPNQRSDYVGLDTRDVEGSLLSSAYLKMKYLVEQNPALMADIKKAAAEAKNEDWKLSGVLREMIRKEGGTEAFEAYAQKYIASLNAEPKFFKGFTYSGKRKYADYTAENVSKDMNAQNIRGAEGSFGGGSIRAQVAKKFSNLGDIKKARNNIVNSDEMDTAKLQLEDYYDDVNKKMEQYGENSNLDHTRNLEDYLSGDREGRKFFLETYGQDGKIPDDLMQAISTLQDKLKNAPTEYFESKFKRVVQPSEFTAALVPENTSKEAIQLLEDNGLTVYRHADGEDSALLERLMRQGKIPLFAAAGVMAGIAGTSEAAANDELSSETMDKYGLAYPNKAREALRQAKKGATAFGVKTGDLEDSRKQGALKSETTLGRSNTAVIKDRDIKIPRKSLETELGAILYGELNANPTEKEMEEITNTILNRMKTDSRNDPAFPGKRSLEEVVSQKNQYQAYNGDLYRKYKKGDFEKGGKQKAEKVKAFIQRLVDEGLDDNTDQSLFYLHGGADGDKHRSIHLAKTYKQHKSNITKFID